MIARLLGRRAAPRRARLRHGLMLLAAFVLGGFGVLGIATPRSAAQQPTAAPGTSTESPDLLGLGREVYDTSCSSCHGADLRGIPQRGPNLRGVGEIAADFYVSTGRMPLADPNEQPVRNRPAFSPRQIRAVVAYVGSFGGPRIPPIAPEKGSLAEGREKFTLYCAGCHQVVAQGGAIPQGIAPPLQQATATNVAEAIRIGPYVMPRWTEQQIDQDEANSLARYVLWTREAASPGGWGINFIGPVPEGMVAWGFGLLALLLVARVIGERAPR
jgi:ubiquinol-cytochrome c reductase cytochrome c subunit